MRAPTKQKHKYQLRSQEFERMALTDTVSRNGHLKGPQTQKHDITLAAACEVAP